MNIITARAIEVSAHEGYPSGGARRPWLRLETAAAVVTIALVLWPRSGMAQIRRDENWSMVSDVGVAVASTSVLSMPRMYEADRGTRFETSRHWHLSMFAPAMTMATLTILVEFPIKQFVGSPRPGCGVDLTSADVTGSDCETFGGPSSHAFAAMGAAGMGFGIFFVDTLKYSNRFSGGLFLGNVLVPVASSVLTMVGRTVAPDGFSPYEDTDQVAAGALPGFFTGLTLGVVYAMFQPPGCKSREAAVCW